MSRTISLEVSDRMAEIFEDLTPDERSRVRAEVLLSLLKRRADRPRDTDWTELERLQREIADEASRNGLTPEILQEIIKREPR